MASGVIDLSLRSETPLTRRRLWVRIAVIVTAIGAVFALALLPNPARAATGPVVIKMADTPAVYAPAKVTVKVGVPVEWINTGKTVHSVTLVPDDAQNPKDATEPKGAKTFDSGFMPPGGTFSYTFTVPGTYHYFCVPHEKARMVGVVSVKK
ncbi:MAG TPA: plastocyanin/azurin family copper-binding protein [Candidatus Binataceae bacterium]|nr:plastocyanin/azurin family copper-binding protein [Candidatus Binataceae bacterium]